MRTKNQMIFGQESIDFAINDKEWSLLIGFFVLRWYYENIWVQTFFKNYVKAFSGSHFRFCMCLVSAFSVSFYVIYLLLLSVWRYILNNCWLSLIFCRITFLVHSIAYIHCTSCLISCTVLDFMLFNCKSSRILLHYKTGSVNKQPISYHICWL